MGRLKTSQELRVRGVVNLQKGLGLLSVSSKDPVPSKCCTVGHDPLKEAGGTEGVSSCRFRDICTYSPT